MSIVTPVDIPSCHRKHHLPGHHVVVAGGDLAVNVRRRPEAEGIVEVEYSAVGGLGCTLSDEGVVIKRRPRKQHGRRLFTSCPTLGTVAVTITVDPDAGVSLAPHSTSTIIDV